MRRFKSSVNTASNEFAANVKHNNGVIDTLRQRLEFWQGEGHADNVARARKSNKMTGRERIQLLLDEDSPFLALGGLAGYGQPGLPEGNPMCAGVGVVCGIECMIVSNIFTVGAGSMNDITGATWLRASQISHENKLPFIQLLESSGLDLSKSFLFHTKPNWFYKMAKRSAAMIPTVSIVFGTCIAGGAYYAGMSDYLIMVKEQGRCALAGTKLVKVATGEDSSEEALGGAEMHSRQSGLSDFLGENETHAIQLARGVIATFPAPSKAPILLSAAKLLAEPSQRPFEEPHYSPEELLGIVPDDPKHSYDCREVIARLVDGSRMTEFKPAYGSTCVTVWANIYGTPVGIIGNNGVIMTESAQKATHFVNACCQRGVPLIFLHNVSGFMVGQQYESGGIIKWGSQMVNAVSNATVPRISIMIGGSFGAAHYAMVGHGFEPRFMFSWPNSKCAVMGPDQLSGVMELLARSASERKGLVVDEAKMAKQTTAYKAKVEAEMDAYYTSSRDIDDGIIDPRDTRKVLAMCLSVVCNAPIEKGFLTGLSRL